MYFIAFKKALCVSAALLLMPILLLGCPGTGPTALFTASPTSGAAPLSVAFTDLSTPGSSPITAWAWDFGDGTTSTEQHPSHTYANAGSYGVSITVTTDVGTASESKADYITVNVLPEAAFSASPTSGIAPLEVAFTDASTPGSSPITAWVWDFGDGTTSTEQHPAHTYTEAGTYDVSLTVSSAAGSATETRTQYVAVAALPAAAFSASPTAGLGPLAVIFTDASTPGSSPITAWAWDFGDGGSSAEQNPSHTYTAPGVYAVALTVTTEVGSVTETRPGYITVTALPTPDFSALPTSGIAPLTVGFTDLSTPGTSPITGWVWLFGDGESSSEQNPVHTYTHPGTYSVTLTVASEVGSVSVNKADFIVVRELPTAAFSATPTSGTAPLNVMFTDASTPGSFPITAWAWDFGDGGTSTEQHPTHTYTAQGSYSMSLTVTTDVGSNSETKTDFIVINKDVWYVKAGASGGAGNSWDAALGSIQDAVDAASAAGGGKVWVAAGTYTGLEEQVLLMRASVALYGGFLGTESLLDQRDWNANRTIIDGENTRRCAVGEDNAGLDGFVLQNGRHTKFGGGLYCYQTCPAVINCTFSGNSATYGGGLYCYHASPALTNCTFSGNTADSGGGLFCWFGSVALTNCAFSGNTANWDGGGMYCESDSSMVTNCSFYGNTAAKGGGLYCYYASPALTNCTFSGNTGNWDGGGMFCYYASPALTNCTFSGNTASNSGGGMYCYDLSSPALTNCILWGDGTAGSGREIYTDSSSSPIVTYSCVQGGYAGEGNTATDPLFVNEANGNLSLRPTSPCIDAGTPDGAPSADIRGVPRPQGAGVDMGAYEFEDLDGDGLSDSWERTYFGDLSAQPGDDPDGDGLTNLEESLYSADPTRADSDGDGLPDGEEVRLGWNPMVPTVVLRANVGNASGVEDGLSWATAFSSLQAAVNAVKTTGEGEVWVAQGTYTGTGDNVVTMTEHVYLYGGFAGTETAREKRDWITHPSIIEGESVRRCVLGADHAALDGFMQQNGYADFGGGMYCSYSSPAVINCTFSGNSAGYCGGGLYCNDASPTLTNCTFSKNTAFLGGGMYCNDASPVLTNCTFSGNISTDHGDYKYCYHVSPTVTNCSFAEKTAYNYYRGSLYCIDASSPVLTNCILWGDSTAGSGKQIYTDASSSPIVTYSCIQGAYTGEGNLASDPLFVNAARDDLSLRPTSPCIDAGMADGAPSADIRGVPRPQGAGVDMGAYEFEDLDGDGLSDSWERTYFGDLSAQPGDDPDGDGLTNLEESLYGADPTRADSDGDGLFDGEEVRLGWNPMVPTVFLRANVGSTSGVEDGLSWATAFTSIQAAVGAVQATGEGEVWVAQGTYTGTGDNVVTMAEHVYLYGGFAGTETAREQRDWTTHPSIIEGESVRRCVLGSNHAAMDGFVLQNGSAVYGGGLYSYSGSPAVTNCIFTRNTADDYGGGMYCEFGFPVVTNCSFAGNRANYGGGMYCEFGFPVVTNCSFAGNRANYGGGGLCCYGASPALTNCTFSGNTVNYGGGGLYCGSGSPVLTNCSFFGNIATSGGGMCGEYGSPVVTNCSFSGNIASYRGGGMCCYYASPALTNCILWGDTAANSGGEIYTDSSSSPTVAYSCVQGGYDGEGNIATDPLFVDAANGDLRLQAASPCIDTGTADGAPSTDILGVLRPQGAGYDMGAYEYAGK